MNGISLQFAGYTGDAAELARRIDTMLAAAEAPARDDAPLAVVSPHAGYVYSGPIAAYAYRAVQGRTFDTVVSGLVLCSVTDPDRALAEVRRVLRPGGALRLLEHVRDRGVRGALQDLLQPAWTALSGGCHPNRDTEAAVERAGFRIEAESVRRRGTMRRLQARSPAAAATPPPGAAK